MGGLDSLNFDYMDVTEIETHRSRLNAILQKSPALKDDIAAREVLFGELSIYLVEFGVEMRITGQNEVREVLGKALYSQYCRNHPA